MELSAQQQDAVEYIGTPTLVVAGAGSGKTRTLTAKIAHLIQKGYDPRRILAITFTNKAAEEMKRRLISQTGMPEDQFPWVRTYHSACLRILKSHGHLLGFTYPIQIYGDYQQLKLLTEIVVGRLNFDKKNVRGVQSQISNAKNFGDPDAYFQQKPYFSRIRVSEVYKLYEEALKTGNAVDFDNILLLTRNLLRDFPEVRKKYRDYFQYILCDEYQDTNNINEEITRLILSNGNLFAVGDDWQSVYSFRMSNVDHFLSFEKKYKKAKIFRLERNFRSAHEIVRLANDLISHNRHRMEKECYSEIRGGLIEIHDFFSDEDEARWVGRKIKSLSETGISLSRMAILYRTKFCSLAFEQAFRHFGIPYRMLGGRGFFERREILDLNCYLTAAVFIRDDAAFDRVVNVPKRGIGPGTIKKINGLRTSDMSLQMAARKAMGEKILTPKLYNAIKELLGLLDDIKEMKPDKAIREVLQRTGYREYMKGYSENENDLISREENIEQLLWSAAAHTNIPDYLEEANLIREDKEADGQESSAVNLSTVHASKGLEYNVVFVAACEEQLFPHWRSLEKESDLEEERRLMYVSMTRSEKYLYLTHAQMRKGNFNRKSRFIDEIEEAMD